MRGFELSSVEKRGRESFSAGAGEKDSRPLFDDAVLDFEILANRPDCLSVIGLAREAATAYSLPLLKIGALFPGILGKRLPDLRRDVTVTLEAPDLCPRYSAAVADVTVGPSPEWLAARLQAAGVRPINNVVDVTNYVLLELGQPMHAFDLAKLAGGELRIRRAVKGERIKTLDGADRALEAGMLVIADAQKPQAVAGVMGGGLSEVSASTKTIVLESACFQPKSVRLTSKTLGLKTEASARFERGTDISAPVTGIARALELLEQIGAGKPRGATIDEYPAPAAPKTLTLRQSRIARVLGQAVPNQDVERICAASTSDSGVSASARRNDAGLGRDRAHVSRRRLARGRSHRRSGPALRLRPPAHHVPGARGAAAARGPADRTRQDSPPRAAGRRAARKP